MQAVSMVQLPQRLLAPADRWGLSIRCVTDPVEAERARHGAEIWIGYGSEGRGLGKEVEAAERLRWYHVLSAGVDPLPLEELARRHVIVTNSRGIHAIPIAEYVIGAMLANERHFYQLWEAQRAHSWQSKEEVGELSGKSVVIVGTGAIGNAIAARARALGMRVFGVNTAGRLTPGYHRIWPVTQLKEAASLADYFVLALPLTRATYHLVDVQVLSHMRPSAVLINIARGRVVDEMALLNALTQGRIRGAVLDVVENEPLPADHPFWSMPNVWITAHSSGHSPFYLDRAMAIFWSNVPLFLQGAPLEQWINVVDLERGY
ncbi:MAG: D-2-hydroxyacid dehydrogenase [Firmicutes bacterium]|nr:D-2-hydroxyacid dehydrogenase [Bacillota bacterium]